MNNPGRPKKKPSERKSERLSVRMTPNTKKRLIERYGSVQVFFDNCVKGEGE